LPQLSLFNSTPDEPSGLSYRPEFITRTEEELLITHIRALPLAPFQFGQYEGKRRVAYFGSKYDFTHQRLEDAEPIPAWLLPLVIRVEEFAALSRGRIDHALVTEYETGAGIGWHRDKKQFDEVFGLSLGSPCNFRFRKKSGPKWERYSFIAEPRSLYVMSGEARHEWEHSIPGVDAPRYSITFRTMAQV
jgi:alkylated DNA repair dioxygenase AlkB